MSTVPELRTVAVVGAGAIGASWAALVLSRGLSVVVHDPSAAARDRLMDGVAIRMEDLDGPSTRAWQDRLEVVPSLADAASRADLVLEGGPERLDVKRSIFAELDAHAAPEVLLTSSSSGLSPSSFQEACERHPGRVVVAHPFNPPHLVPLVEVVGGRLTSEDAVARAMEVFRRLGKQPVRLHRELPGHVVNRLQAALWREAYHLVEQGVVSVADLDLAVSSGPGLRWALLGPFATQHLSGGPGGLAHVLDHLGPPMVEWWQDLGEPELTPELVARLVDGVGRELGDRPLSEMTARRDAALRELLAIKLRHGLD